ncbi:hypothetical protein EB73_06675 [Mycobacterium sp. SWH-M3]|nr:hypothetical protein EB73_06675 [Mycobacterium sp. SWH-M3]
MTVDDMDALRQQVRVDLSKYGPDALLPKIDDTVMESVRGQMRNRRTHQHAAMGLAGSIGGGKTYRYQRALTVFAGAGCIITPGEDDLFAFGVVAPEGMSNEEFRELIQRAWYW